MRLVGLLLIAALLGGCATVSTTPQRNPTGFAYARDAPALDAHRKAFGTWEVKRAVRAPNESLLWVDHIRIHVSEHEAYVEGYGPHRARIPMAFEGRLSHIAADSPILHYRFQPLQSTPTQHAQSLSGLQGGLLALQFSNRPNVPIRVAFQLRPDRVGNTAYTDLALVEDPQTRSAFDHIPPAHYKYKDWTGSTPQAADSHHVRLRRQIVDQLSPQGFNCVDQHSFAVWPNRPSTFNHRLRGGESIVVAATTNSGPLTVHTHNRGEFFFNQALDYPMLTLGPPGRRREGLLHFQVIDPERGEIPPTLPTQVTLFVLSRQHGLTSSTRCSPALQTSLLTKQTLGIVKIMFAAYLSAAEREDQVRRNPGLGFLLSMGTGEVLASGLSDAFPELSDQQRGTIGRLIQSIAKKNACLAATAEIREEAFQSRLKSAAGFNEALRVRLEEYLLEVVLGSCSLR